MSLIVDVDGTKYELLGRPFYHVAHPDDGVHIEEEHVCDKCAIARRMDNGTYTILWLVGGINWSVNRVMATP